MRKFLLTLAVVGSALGLAAPADAAVEAAIVRPAVFTMPVATPMARDMVQTVQYRHRRHRRYRHHR